MRTFFLLSGLYFFLLMACNKDADTKKLQEGTYIGTFQRELDWADNDTANITIIFSSNTWSGSSDKTKYPALCHGSYSINNITKIPQSL